jgi:hypothetical protein
MHVDLSSICVVDLVGHTGIIGSYHKPLATIRTLSLIAMSEFP